MTSDASRRKAAPGWYTTRDGRKRYWDGAAWTDRFQTPETVVEEAPQTQGREAVVEDKPVTQTPAGWYPVDGGSERYWSGSEWTDQTRPSAQVPPSSTPQQSTQSAQTIQSSTPGPYYQPAVPAKKSHAVRNVLLILLVVFILFIASCMALLGGAANEVDKALNEDGSSLSEEEQNDTPATVKPGRAFTHDDFKAARGWRVVKEDVVNSVTIKNLRVTNVSSEGQRTALLTFRFYKGTEVLAEVECSTNEMQAGESSRMQCFSTSDGFPTGYKTIKVSDAF